MAQKQVKKANPGRKALPEGEKKIGVTLYIKESTVEKHGGRSGVVIKLMPAIDKL